MQLPIRTARVLVGATITAGLAAAAPVAVAADTEAASSVSVTRGPRIPSTGIYLGAANRPTGGQSYAQAFDGLEAKTGTRLGVHRTYQQWNVNPIDATVRWDVAGGRLPAVSIKPPGTWGQVASGALDAAIARQADAVKAFGHPMLLTFHHEPDNDTDRGTPADYRAAWRRWAGIYRARGVTNAALTHILIASSYARGAAHADSFYPGDDVVDWLGVDGYNWNPCKAGDWRSFAQVFSAFRTWAASRGKPIFIAEVGANEDRTDPGRKAQWIRDMLTTLKGWPQVKAVAWFNTTIGPATCRWLVDTSANSLTAWRGIARDAYTQADLTGVSVGTPPEALTWWNDGRTGTGVTVHAGIDPRGQATTYRFEYGRTTAYGSTTAAVSAGSANGRVKVAARLSGLTPSATYHYRVVATSAAGTTYGGDRVATLPSAATAGTDTATWGSRTRPEQPQRW
jgi:hypothetical protein